MIKWLLGTPPEVGTVWTLIGEWNPFDPTQYSVRIVETKDGWVKYNWYWDNAGSYPNYKSIRWFRMLYKEIK